MALDEIFHLAILECLNKHGGMPVPYGRLWDEIRAHDIVNALNPDDTTLQQILDSVAHETSPGSGLWILRPPTPGSEAQSYT